MRNDEQPRLCACAQPALTAAARPPAPPPPLPPPPLPPVQVFDLGNHYLQSSNQKLLTGGMGSAGALTLGTTAGPLTTSEIKAVKGMPSDVVIGRWKETVRELGNILVQVRRWRAPALCGPHAARRGGGRRGRPAPA